MSTITFAGNLAADPELRYTTTGKPVVEFRVVVNNRTQVNGQWVDATPTNHNVKLFGPGAENTAASLAKGNRVLVTGRVTTDSWEDRETGEARYRDVIIADEIGASTLFATVEITKATAADQ